MKAARLQVGGVLLAHLPQHGEAALVGGELGQPDVDHRADESLAQTALRHAGREIRDLLLDEGELLGLAARAARRGGASLARSPSMAWSRGEP